MLTKPSEIVEVGPANGRDARFWASRGHKVHCVEFSRVALEQLTDLACSQGVIHRISPHHHDISLGHLPLAINGNVDGFYARSALHVDDETLGRLMTNVNTLLRPKATIAIEGKGPLDMKMDVASMFDQV
ncbi:MAG: class I SAM-dependent methyltransferase [Patescibacteria group bacterium]